MLKYIEEFGKYVLITGFRNVKIKNQEEFLKKTRKDMPLNVEFQFFDARFVATWEHLYFAVLNALTAFESKENISKSLAMETMIYASAQRQIQRAMKNLGIKPETSEIALVIIGDNSVSLKSALSKISASTKMQLDETVLKLTKEKERVIRERFGVSDLELKTVKEKNALTNLVIERMALSAVQR